MEAWTKLNKLSRKHGGSHHTCLHVERNAGLKWLVRHHPAYKGGLSLVYLEAF
jgi:hypothetical protein